MRQRAPVLSWAAGRAEGCQGGAGPELAGNVAAGQEFEGCARSMLRRQLRELQALGYGMRAGWEMEVPVLPPPDGLVAGPCYGARALRRCRARAVEADTDLEPDTGGGTQFYLLRRVPGSRPAQYEPFDAGAAALLQHAACSSGPGTEGGLASKSDACMRSRAERAADLGTQLLLTPQVPAGHHGMDATALDGAADGGHLPALLPPCTHSAVSLPSKGCWHPAASPAFRCRGPRMPSRQQAACNMQTRGMACSGVPHRLMP